MAELDVSGSFLITIGRGDGPETWIVVSTNDENGKPMVLNRTNWDTLEEAFGDSDDWAGHKVRIKTARTKFQGKPVDGIRLDAIKPKPALKDDLDDEIPDDFGKKSDNRGEL